MHINNLEDIVITLSDSEDDSVSYKKAQRKAKKIKRKRQEKQSSYTDESNTSKESNSRKRVPRFQKQIYGNTPRYYSLDVSLKKNSMNNKKDDNGIGMNTEYNKQSNE